MTALLASVKSAEEAALALAGGADVIDLKDPSRGALGALPTPIIAEAVVHVGGRRPVSATAGDLAMLPEIVTGAVERIAATGVDFVKLGLFPDGDARACLKALGQRSGDGAPLVAVLFADRSPDLGLIEVAAGEGFVGIMIDTAGKRSAALSSHLTQDQLRAFVERTHRAGLFVGLAGSLSLADIEPVLRLRPDYLGFRGALTRGGRDAALDPGALDAVRRAIPREKSRASAMASKATAAAGAQQAAASRASA